MRNITNFSGHNNHEFALAAEPIDVILYALEEFCEVQTAWKAEFGRKCIRVAMRVYGHW